MARAETQVHELLAAEPPLPDFARAVKAKSSLRWPVALRRLAQMRRDYPRDAFLSAVTSAAHFGMYELDRLERRSSATSPPSTSSTRSTATVAAVLSATNGAYLTERRKRCSPEPPAPSPRSCPAGRLSFLRRHEHGATMMIKKLSAVGNSLGLIIERPILDLLDITKDTPLEVKTDGEALIIRPMKKATAMDRALAAADELMDAHDATFRKLAK